VITADDIARLQPVAGDQFNLMIGSRPSEKVQTEQNDDEGAISAKIGE
jgi:hypothetical protein